MFIGHYAAALAAKRAAPGLSLGLLFLAAQLVDLLWPIFLLLGLERVEIDPGNTAVTPLDFVFYPWTHSLVAGVVWGALLAFLVYWRNHRVRASVVAGLLVVSHWVLDVIAHRPDLPIASDAGTKVGLGLWNSLPATVVVEGILFLGGLAIYLRVTKPRRGKRAMAFWSLIAFIVIVYVANLMGPPPPAVEPIAWVGLAAWLLPLWAWWADRNREISGASHEGVPD